MLGDRLLGMKNFRSLDDGKNKNVKLAMSNVYLGTKLNVKLQLL